VHLSFIRQVCLGECCQWGYWTCLTSVEGCETAPGVRVSHSPFEPQRDARDLIRMNSMRRSRRIPKAVRRRQVRPQSTAHTVANGHSWTFQKILGLTLTLIGAISSVELRPQISVSTQEPIERSQPFSVPFRISNTGYLPFYVEHAYCYAREITWGTISMNHILERSKNWDGYTLDQGESKTILCDFLDAPTPPQKADLMIVVDYRLAKHLPGAFRKLAHFTGAYVDNWQWLRQPSDDIAAEASSEIDRLLRKRSGQQFVP
jgi:hypothetical protein